MTTQDYYSLIIIVWCVKLKPKIFKEDFSADKEMIHFSNHSAKSK